MILTPKCAVNSASSSEPRLDALPAKVCGAAEVLSLSFKGLYAFRGSIVGHSKFYFSSSSLIPEGIIIFIININFFF